MLNLARDSTSPLALILVGQTELWDRLSLHASAAIRQRIDIPCRVPYLDRAQTAADVQAHLTYAGTGTDHALFSDSALDALDRYSSGAARLIHKAATHALLDGAQNGHRVLDDAVVTRVIQGELA